MTIRFIVAAALLAASCASQAAVVYGSNLVVNGDAEAGMTGWNGYAAYSPFQTVDYGSNWVLPTQPGPADRGSKMFAGLGQYAVGWQTLDLGTSTQGQIAYSLSGWLGGWADQGDNALFYVQFLDDVGNHVPAGTRSLSFWLSMERLVSNDNDGYADNLSFVLRAPAADVPEPGMAATFALGLGLLGWAGRRKRIGRR